MQLPSATSTATMSSLEMVDFINNTREDGEAELRHRDFMVKVPKVLGEGVCETFRAPYIHPQNGQTYNIYRFPKREACLMAMSYSYSLQAKVFDHMTALEDQVAKPAPTPAPQLLSPLVQVIADNLAVAALFNVPVHLAQSEAVKDSLRLNGRDFSHLLAVSPAQSDIRPEDEMLEPTELGRVVGMSAIKLNLALASAGLQVKALDGWHLTEQGSKLATRHHWTKGEKSGYNFKWRKSVLDLIAK